MEITSW